MLPNTSLSSLVSPSATTQQFTGSDFNAEGIAGVDGGYAYVPGSSMAAFMDQINRSVALASQGTNGMDIITWANSLVQQNALRNQQAAAAAAAQQQAAQQQAAQQQQTLASATGSTTSATGGSNTLVQLLQSLLSMLLSQMSTGMNTTS